MITSAFLPGNGDISEPLMIRREVFIEEQGCPENEDRDGMDEAALHLIVYVDEIPAATGRIWHDGSVFRIGRLAVRKRFRGQRIGDLALRLLLYKAFNSGAEELFVNAQVYIKDMYKKFGFKECGGEFVDAGLPHIPMSLKKDDVVYPSACGHNNKDTE
jgi:predicted GNAT family N-acyltransferase